MQRKLFVSWLVPLLVIGVIILLAAGCKPKPVREKVSELDTPDHHVRQAQPVQARRTLERFLKPAEAIRVAEADKHAGAKAPQHLRGILGADAAEQGHRRPNPRQPQVERAAVPCF